MINIVIPMAGQGKRFKNAGFLEPKPMIDIAGKKMIEWALESLSGLKIPHSLIFIAMKQDLDAGLNKILNPLGKVIGLTDATDGAVNSTLQAKQLINSDTPLIISCCDQYLNWDINDFVKNSVGYDASIAVFKSSNPHHSYISVDNKNVTHIEEKIVISDLACGGIYFYKSGNTFVNSAESLIAKNVRTQGEFYLSPVLNELISNKKSATYFELDQENIHMLGTPEEISVFLNKKENGESNG
jgi:dTDP-glucose pyrophosphorylase